MTHKKTELRLCELGGISSVPDNVSFPKCSVLWCSVHVNEQTTPALQPGSEASMHRRPRSHLIQDSSYPQGCHISKGHRQGSAQQCSTLRIWQSLWLRTQAHLYVNQCLWTPQCSKIRLVFVSLFPSTEKYFEQNYDFMLILGPAVRSAHYSLIVFIK